MFSSEGRKFSCYRPNANVSVIFHGKRSFIVIVSMDLSMNDNMINTSTRSRVFLCIFRAR